MVDKPLPIDASVKATSGAASKRYSTDAKSPTAPVAIMATFMFLW